jgi:hypothetical protein
MKPDNKPNRYPYGSADVIRIAYECDVCIDTVRQVLKGGSVSSRARQRVYRKLAETGKLHWVGAKPAEVKP